MISEFVNLLSSESNDISTKEKKNTIHPEHVLKALEDLGFGEFVPEVHQALALWKEENKSKSCNSIALSGYDSFFIASMRTRGHKTAADAAGMTEEQQIAVQQKLFAEAKARSGSFQESQPFIRREESYLSEAGSITFSDNANPFAVLLASEPTSVFTELASRSDVLPIRHLPVPQFHSDFTPPVINATSFPLEPRESEQTIEEPLSAPTEALDFRHLPLSQPVIVLHNGVQHVVSWHMLLSQVELLSSSQPQIEKGEFPMQMPNTTGVSHVIQPSFPERIESMQSATANGCHIPRAMPPVETPSNERLWLDETAHKNN